METASGLEDALFVLMTLGDERAVRATYVCGEVAHRGRDRPKRFARVRA
jgi:hypothetical protein